MIQETTTLYLYVETPLHAGTGSGLSSVDLPIQRERHTQYPMIQGSGVKGKLRAAATADSGWNKEDVAIVFGPEKDGSEHAGSLIAGDARILLFPVRSLMGIFAYVTSRDVLSRFQLDISRARQELSWSVPEYPKSEAPEEEKESPALVTTNSRVIASNTLVLEEFNFEAEKRNEVDAIAEWLVEHALPEDETYAYWRGKLKESLVILPDNDFRDFVVNATEIITRVRINQATRTVENGALWTEEHLPNDTLLYVPIYATHARKQRKGEDGSSMNEPAMSAREILAKARTIAQASHNYLQLGGDETVGRGMVRMQWDKEGK